MKKLFIFTVLLLMVKNVYAENEIPVTNVPFTPLDVYEKRQKPRDGQYVFIKDPNIWVYNREFAKRFGMPEKWINDGLKGAVAIAFRMQKANYEDCGYGGDINACHRPTDCLFDVYLTDEDGEKLPWENYKTSDWRNFGSSDFFINGRTKNDYYYYYYDNVNNKKYVRGGRGLSTVAFVYGKPSNQDILSKLKNMVSGKIPDNRSFAWETWFDIMSYRRDFLKGLDIITGNACQIADKGNDGDNFHIYFSNPAPVTYDPKYNDPNDVLGSARKYNKAGDEYRDNLNTGNVPHKIKVPDEFMKKVHLAYKKDETDSKLVNKVKKITGSK